MSQHERLILVRHDDSGDEYFETEAVIGVKYGSDCLVNSSIEMIILCTMSYGEEVAIVEYFDKTSGRMCARFYTMDGECFPVSDFPGSFGLDLEHSEVIYWRGIINELEKIVAREEAMRDA